MAKDTVREETPGMRPKDYGKTSSAPLGESHEDQVWERPVPDPLCIIRGWAWNNHYSVVDENYPA